MTPLPSYASIMLAESVGSRPGRYSGFIIKRSVFEIWLNVFKAQLFPYNIGQVPSLNLSFIICKNGDGKDDDDIYLLGLL